MEFSGSLPSKANLKLKVPLKYSHFVSLDSSELLEAATKDLVSIFKLKVSQFHYDHDQLVLLMVDFH